jgi:hypothetical protein
MKKVLLIAVVAVFGMGLTSCGGHVCDAYRKADYSKYKVDHNKKIEMIQNLTETVK